MYIHCESTGKYCGISSISHGSTLMMSRYPVSHTPTLTSPDCPPPMFLSVQTADLGTPPPSIDEDTKLKKASLCQSPATLEDDGVVRGGGNP